MIHNVAIMQHYVLRFFEKDETVGIICTQSTFMIGIEGYMGRGKEDG